MGISHDDLAILERLRNASWSETVAGIQAASRWMDTAAPGDARIDAIATALASLASHTKWEVRHALVHVAEKSPAEVFDRVLAALASDSHARVKASATKAIVRRKDRRLVTVLDRQHAERVMTILDDVEGRHGLRIRQAVQRAAEDVGNTFARELHHEIVKLLAPLTLSVSRIRDQVGVSVSPSVGRELDRVDVDIQRLNAVLDGMREYAHTPRLVFAKHAVAEVLMEAAELVRSASGGNGVDIEVDVSDAVSADISRPRLVQALRNILANAVESYSPGRHSAPVHIGARGHDGYVVIQVVDRGAGMSASEADQARQLFATTKPTGTGFGLPLAIRIIEGEHDGRLSIDSHLGQGTTVSVTLPIKRP